MKLLETTHTQYTTEILNLWIVVELRMTVLIIIQLKSHFSIIEDLVNLSILLSQSIKCQYVTYDSIFLIILITLDAFLRVLSIKNQCHLFSIASAPKCEYFELNREDCDEGSWTSKIVDSLQGVIIV